MTLHVVDLASAEAQELALTGGKGANLAKMVDAGLPVPDGFVVTTAAYRAHSEGTGLAALQDEAQHLAAEDHDAVAKLGQQARELLEGRNLPAEVRAAVLQAYRALGDDQPVAVRSSATAEDLPDASSAGQQDTHLNVHGEEALLSTVRACMASLFTDRAIAYRLRNRIPQQDVALAVVVQVLVEPEASGILFTADPITGHRDTTAIDAGLGLGEALVQGTVEADLIKVDKRELAVTERKIGHQTTAIRSAPGGGTVEQALQDRADVPAIDDETAVALTRYGIELEAMMGGPQDIEWAVTDEGIHLLQSRPITSLFPLPEPRPPEDELHVYFSFGHGQGLLDPMPPMSLWVWRTVMSFGRPQGTTGPNPWAAHAAGRMYLDLTSLVARPRIGHLLSHALQNADPSSARALAHVLDERSLEGSPTASLTSVASHILPMQARALAWALFKDPTGQAAEARAWIEADAASIVRRIQAPEAPADRLRAIEAELSKILERYASTLPPRFLTGMAAKGLLKRLLPGHEEDIEALGRGLVGTVTTEMDLALGDLADEARAHPEVGAALREGASLAAIEEAEGGHAFISDLEAFLDEHGFRANAEIDPARPRWREDPSALLKVIAGNLSRGEAGEHRRHHERLRQEAEAAADRLIDAARTGLLGPFRARLVARAIRLHRELMPLRELPKYAIVQVLDVVRDEVRAAGGTLAEAGRLEDPEDVWYLGLDELIAALDDPSLELTRRIQARQQDYVRYAELKPPGLVTSRGEAPIVPPDRDNVPEGALVGSPASAGVVEGTARVVLDPRGSDLQPGEILVAPFTDPGWTPLFLNAAGLVMEVGGLMTHGSVVAREYGLPAVVSVRDATTRIETGDRLRVDGDQGIVEVLG